MYLARQIFIIALIALLGRQANANNNFFLPGDAFFYSEPNHQWFESLATSENPVVQYQRPRKGSGGRFCGYAGYDKMQLDNFTPEMRANLVKAYQQLRSQYPQEIEVHQRRTMRMQDGKLVPVGEQDSTQVEHNLVSMLICNRDFDLEKFRPLFRYNENWADAAAAFGHPRDQVAYDFFIDDASSITDDWRDSPLVQPLKFATPEPIGKQERLKNVLISVDCQEIQILLFPTSFYEDIAFPNEEFVYQLESTTRAAQEAMLRMEGGLFSIQDALDFESATDDHDEQESEESEELLPHFAYRATCERCEILKPVNGHWVIAEE